MAAKRQTKIWNSPQKTEQRENLHHGVKTFGRKNTLNTPPSLVGLRYKAVWHAWVRAKSLQWCPTLSTLCTVAHQAPLSMEFSRQEYWSGLLCPPPGDLPNSGIESTSLTSPSLPGSATWEVPCLTWGRKNQVLGSVWGTKDIERKAWNRVGPLLWGSVHPSHLRSIFHVTCLINPACASFPGLSFQFFTMTRQRPRKKNHTQKETFLLSQLWLLSIW